MSVNRFLPVSTHVQETSVPNRKVSTTGRTYGVTPSLSLEVEKGVLVRNSSILSLRDGSIKNKFLFCGKTRLVFYSFRLWVDVSTFLRVSSPGPPRQSTTTEKTLYITYETYRKNPTSRDYMFTHVCRERLYTEQTEK